MSSFTRVSTGVATYRWNCAARAAASAASVTTKGAPIPTRAMPSMMNRFTPLPMPKANKLASPRFRRISSKVSFSTSTYPSVTTTTVRAAPSCRGRARARSRAGSSSVPPPPRTCSMTWIPWSRFSAVAGRERSAIIVDPPAKSTTLNRSTGRSPPSRSRINCLVVSRGKPRMDPETSTTKMYSRGGTWSGATRAGGCTISRKKFSCSPSWSSKPEWICSPCSRYLRM